MEHTPLFSLLLVPQLPCIELLGEPPSYLSLVFGEVVLNQWEVKSSQDGFLRFSLK